MNLYQLKKGVTLAIHEYQALKAQIYHVDAMIALALDEHTPHHYQTFLNLKSVRPPQSNNVSGRLSHIYIYGKISVTP